VDMEANISVARMWRRLVVRLGNQVGVYSRLGLPGRIIGEWPNLVVRELVGGFGKRVYRRRILFRFYRFYWPKSSLRKGRGRMVSLWE